MEWEFQAFADGHREKWWWVLGDVICKRSRWNIWSTLIRSNIFLICHGTGRNITTADRYVGVWHGNVFLLRTCSHVIAHAISSLKLPQSLQSANRQGLKWVWVFGVQATQGYTVIVSHLHLTPFSWSEHNKQVDSNYKVCHGCRKLVLQLLILRELPV